MIVRRDYLGSEKQRKILAMLAPSIVMRMATQNTIGGCKFRSIAINDI